MVTLVACVYQNDFEVQTVASSPIQSLHVKKIILPRQSSHMVQNQKITQNTQKSKDLSTQVIKPSGTCVFFFFSEGISLGHITIMEG